MNSREKGIVKMRISKLHKENWSYSDLRYVIISSRLKLKIPGKITNRQRILNSNLSWQKRIIWAKNIIDYTGSRGENIDWLAVVHNSENKAIELLKIKSDRVTGDKNVWFNHGGKLSVYSEHNPNFTLSKKEIAKQKNSKTQLNGASPRILSYWINKGYSKSDAILKLNDFQNNFTLEKCISKHGEIEGIRKYNDRQEKWQATLNSKSDEEMSIINKKKISSGYNTSKNEKLLFDVIRNQISGVKSQLTLQKPSKGYYCYDISYKNKIIEYNGDFWHMNPLYYDKNDINKRTKKTASEQWELDKDKIEYAKNKGYKVLSIWENDFNSNREEVIQECLNFLK